TNLTILLEVDDLSGGPTAGATHDLLAIAGTFTHGGAIAIDLSELDFGAATEVQVISWASDTGSSGDTSVQFTGGDALAEFRADGLYVTVPEPASFALLGAVLLLTPARRSRRA